MATFKIKREGHNRKYYIILIGFVASFFLFMSSKALFGDSDPIRHTEYNKPISGLTNTQIILKKWEYNPNEKVMEIHLKSEKTNKDLLSTKLKFTARQSQKFDEYATEVIFEENNFYVVQIKDIPEDYKIMKLIVEEIVEASPLETHSEKTTEDEEKVEKGKKVELLGDYRKVEKNEELKTKEKHEYAEEGLSNDIELLDVEIDNLEKTLVLQDESVLKVEDEIIKIDAMKQYQTDQEKAETDSSIKRKQKTIEEIKKQKNEFEKQLEETKKRRDNMKKKLDDRMIEYER